MKLFAIMCLSVVMLYPSTVHSMDLHIFGCNIVLDSSYNIVVRSEADGNLSIGFYSDKYGELNIYRYDGFIPSISSSANVEHYKLKNLDVYEITRIVGKNSVNKQMIQITDGKKKVGLAGPVASDWRNVFKDCSESN
jgi:hypothetical protein